MTDTSLQPKRGRIKRYIEAAGLVVVVEVPVVFAPEQPDEPLLEGETIRFLDEVTARANQRDIAWLSRVGQVYERRIA